MSNAVKITEISPEFAIPGAEIVVGCKGLAVDAYGGTVCSFDGMPGRFAAASQHRVLAAVPEEAGGKTAVRLEGGGDASSAKVITVGRQVAEDMHIVANPAIDPKDDSLVLTRSGMRGQELPNTLYRLEPDGYLDELPVQVMNPTGVAFDPSGQLYVTNRSDGHVLRIERGDEAVVHAAGLGVATGIAFDPEGVMYVGDRRGTIYRIPEPGLAETFATIEPSVAAFHLAFGPDGRLYVTAPALTSYDAVHAIDMNGTVSTYFRGLGRPQGLAFDRDGDLYVAASYKGRRGIVRIPPGGGSADLFVAGSSIVGLCFTRIGEMIVATADSAYSLNTGIYGTLLNDRPADA